MRKLKEFSDFEDGRAHFVVDDDILIEARNFQFLQTRIVQHLLRDRNSQCFIPHRLFPSLSNGSRFHLSRFVFAYLRMILHFHEGVHFCEYFRVAKQLALNHLKFKVTRKFIYSRWLSTKTLRRLKYV